MSEEHKQERRLQILEAAVTCFARKGIHPATMDDICEESGLSRGAVYGYFDSKQEIIQGVLNNWEQQTKDMLQQRLEQSGESGDLLDIFEVYFLMFDPLDDRARNALHLDIAFKAEMLHDPALREMGQAQSVAVVAHFVALITDLQRQGRIEPSLDPEYLMACLGSMHEGFKNLLAMRPELDAKKYIQTLRAIVDLTPRNRG
ncbi:MAG: TetR/AcrR family transcriptional regulator [Pseudomonadota bacterium]